VEPLPDNDIENGHSPGRAGDDDVTGRVEALAAWIQDLEAQVQTAVAATGDKQALKELRKVIEAQAKRDPKFEERVTERVDVLADRLETLAKTISTTAAALASKDGDIAGLRRQVEERSIHTEAIVAELRRATDPAALAELRRAIASIPDQKSSRRGDDKRLDGLSGKIDNLTQRLDTLGATVATTASGLAGREGDVVALRRQLEDDKAQVETLLSELRTVVNPASVSELRQTLTDLENEVSTAKRDQRRRADALSAKVDSVVGQLDVLSETVATTATGMQGRESEITALRSTLDEETARVDSWLKKLQTSVGELASQLGALGGVAGSDAVQALEGGFERLGGQVNDLAGRLDSVAHTVATTAAGLAGGEGELAALRSRLEERAAEVDTTLAELRQGVGELASQLGALEGVAERGVVEALEARLQGVSTKVDDVAGRFDSLAQTVATTVEEVTEKEGSIAQLQSRFEQASSRVEALVSELGQALQTLPDPAAFESELEPRLEDLAQQVHVLASGLAQLRESTSSRSDDAETLVADLDQRLVQVAEKLEEVEQGQTTASAERERASKAHAEERTWVREQLEKIASTLQDLAASSAHEHEDAFQAELLARVEAAERNGGAAASEMARTAAFWATQLDAIRAQLDELSSDRKRSPDSETSEEGRHRAELHALELRVELAEAAARENQETVLAELGRLAARIESRLEGLESDEGEAAATEIGQLLRLHSREA
jgi:chromosome segregation ATPase